MYNIFEKNKDKFFNTCVIINKNGNIITKYNKNYIPSELLSRKILF